MTLTMDQMEQDPALARFLRATVGEDANGTNISVISMFARLEIDPWAEASDLAAMPDGPARKRLNSLMTRFKDVPSLGRDEGKTTSALLDLLPKKKASANTNTPNIAVGLPPMVMGVPISWYITIFIVLGWIIYLARGQ